MFVIPALKMLREKDWKFKVTLGYMARPGLEDEKSSLFIMYLFI
jgi:hypothetical protein